MLRLMDRYSIIKLKLKGLSNRAVAKELVIDRKTVARYWNEYQKSIQELEMIGHSKDDLRAVQEKIVEAPRYDSSKRKPVKYTKELDAFIDGIFEEEEEKNRKLGNHKQHLTNVQIHELVTEAGFDIGRSTLSEHLKIKRDQKKESFIRQEYELGERTEYDFGEVKLVIAGVTGKYHMAVLAAPAARHRWAYLYTNQKKDVFIDSHVRYFEMMGGVPKEMVYDNMRNVVHRFIGGNEKKLNPDLIKMAEYYGFEINVTNCFSGNEKGFVESSVRKLRREIFTKRYEFDSFEEAEDYMQQQLERINQDALLEEEKTALQPARPPLELATLTDQIVDKYSFVRVDNNFYSVPDYLVGCEVRVKTYLREICIYVGKHLVARHKKVDGRDQIQADIFHYLDTLARKPGAVKSSKALKSRKELKTIYDTYFSKRTREFISLLRKNADKSEEVLLKILQEYGSTGIIYESSTGHEIEDHVRKQTEEQLEKLTSMYFSGGTHYVH